MRKPYFLPTWQVTPYYLQLLIWLRQQMHRPI